MRRVVSLFLPTWPTDRYRKNASDAPPRDKPLVTAMKVGPRRIIAAADKTALALGLRPGLTVAHAQALVPELHIAEATPEGQRRAGTARDMVSALQPAGRRGPPGRRLDRGCRLGASLRR
jgi:protein ImuB